MKGVLPLKREPWNVLGPLVVAQWIAIAVFSQIVRHNGWLFYQGGDQTQFYTNAVTLSHGHIPESEIGYGWSYLLAPIAGVFGANALAALPVIILFQVLVLGPIALASTYGIASRIGGRLIGYLAAAIWVVGPFVVIPLWDHRYHAKYVEQFLPQGLGLTGLGDYPSMVALLVAAYFCVRAFQTGALQDAVVGGLVTGFAIGLKPANSLFLAAPALGFLIARRIRCGLGFAGAMVPAVVTLAIWKYRGLGHLPILAAPGPRAIAAGQDPLFASQPLLASLSDYINLSWQQLKDNFAQFREFFWSPRPAEWVPIAGAIAAARRSLAAAVFLGVWFGAFFFFKGSSPLVSVEQGTFLRIFMPGFPPYWILTACLPLLWPVRGPRLARRYAPTDRFRLEWRSPPVIGTAIVLAAVPLLLMLAFRPLKGTAATKYYDQNVAVPVDSSFTPEVVVSSRGQDLKWKPPETPGIHVFYVVFRSPAMLTAPDPTLPPGREGIRCLPPTGGASDCRLEMTLIGRTRGTSFYDPDKLKGRWTYRIGIAANWVDDESLGDVMVVSEPTTFTGLG
jgi:hypothetical protein